MAVIVPKALLQLRSYGLELVLLASYMAADLVLTAFFGPTVGKDLLGGLLLAVLSSGAVRRDLVGVLVARDRRRRIQRRLDLALEERAPFVERVEPSAAGEVVTVRFGFGQSREELERHTGAVAAALGAREVLLRASPETSSRCDIVVVRNETLGGLVDPAPLLSTYKPDVFSSIALGIDEAGEPVLLGLVGHHLLIGGETGGGKSGSLNAVLAGVSRDGRCRIWGFDGKRVELSAWRPVLERFCGPEMDEAISMLEELRAEMERRYEALLVIGRTKVEQEDDAGVLVVVIDELAFYVANPERKKAQRFAELLSDVVARGRAAGVVVVAATQKPSAEMVPTALRDNFGYRLAHRCATRDASDTILGAGWASLGYSAAAIDPELRGVGYLLSSGGVPVRMRTMHLEAATIALVVTEAAGRRRSLR